jgi:hypothetical protein
LFVPEEKNGSAGELLAIGGMIMTAKIEPKRGPLQWIAEAGRAVAEVYRKGFGLILAAPAVAAIAVVPEFAQHVAEIELGMFLSREAFVALSADPTRMAFGMVKVAGLILCMLAAARYWAFEGSLKRTFAMPLRDVGRTLFAIALNALVSLPQVLIEKAGLPTALEYPIVAASWILSLLLLAYVVGAVVGDRDMTIARSLKRGWRFLPLLILLGAIAYLPPFALHMGAHWLAIGASEPIVWLVMALDALVVGVLATLVGSALYVAYRRSGV